MNDVDNLRPPGADSVTWRRFGHLSGLFLAGTGLLLQVAHPVVGAGVLQHSEFKAKPWRRAVRTHLSTMRFIYGMRPGAAHEGDRLRELHKGIKGVDGEGRRYHALNPEAYAWVHFTLARFMVDTARVFGDPMTAEETERMWQEFREIGRALHIKDHHMPADWAAAQDWFDRIVRERLEATESTSDVLAELTGPAPPSRWIPLPLWGLFARPAGKLVRLTTVGALPPELRDRLGIRWTAVEERRLRRFGRLAGGAIRVLPWPLQYTPLAVAAILRDRWRTGARLAPAPTGLPAAELRSAAPNRKPAPPVDHQLTGRAT
ncbi:oxygenase MpaB family protein [Saccharopolyspora sp. NFXS83]|uniref:oxygenase MpaB family protein n=1 Tax=Saccharopolyspora sp. NFXS83 TaxID=2993560 RepID=UPI00224B5177|nr:oxygenase MpaB family protein [Saccharopolyspora sp. NFXS83]MCX2730074.1 oxygenase MpaB family protein [Saccharopolyspora sp. NFXS83]